MRAVDMRVEAPDARTFPHDRGAEDAAVDAEPVDALDLGPDACVSAPEVCNGRDDDCDGEIDEGSFGHVGGPCPVGFGACERIGTWICGEAPEPRCDVEPGEPTPERCNEIDDDCDGLVDEGPEGEVGEACDVGIGACARSGRWICAEDPLPVCDAVPGVPAEEVCNGVDDDCDGEIDEGPPPRCYEGPAATEGVGICRGGVRICRDGALAECSGQVLPLAEEVCGNDLDDDCDAVVDEGCPCQEGEQRPCGLAVGACQPGVQVCRVERFGACEGAIAPVAEVCNGVDDDCDGAIDEEAPLTPCYEGPPGTEGVGACVGGGLACVGGAPGGPCLGMVVPKDQDLCDGEDEDCDGVVDEDHVVAASACGVGVCARAGTRECVGGAVIDTCRPGAPEGPDVCNGRDDDCDGRVDEDLASRACFSGPPEVAGIGACLAGLFACVNGGLGEVCEGEVLPRAVDLCDGVDNDCDGRVDEDHEVAPTACGVGECAAVGERRCQGGQVVDTCRAGLPAPRDLCTGRDDDCDGRIDEDFVDGPSTCGTGICRAEGVAACVDGRVQDDCVPGAPQVEICNELDDDCDGFVDEDCPYSQPAIQAMFDTQCVRCHGGGALNLRHDFVENTAGRPAQGAPIDILRRGDHQQSYLYHKLAGTQRSVGGGGSRMPRSGAFWTPYQLRRFALFIDALP